MFGSKPEESISLFPLNPQVEETRIGSKTEKWTTYVPPNGCALSGVCLTDWGLYSLPCPYCI